MLTQLLRALTDRRKHCAAGARTAVMSQLERHERCFVHGMTALKDPSWWNDKHASAWERSKEALRRDWEQTKADFGVGGHELHQSLGDTVEQAAGRQETPPGNRPNSSTAYNLAWNDAEPAVRYGYGARSHHGGSDWNEKLEGTLRKDWETTLTDTPWERVKHAVRRGWDSAKGPGP
jgi:hypothetical protein